MQCVSISGLNLFENCLNTLQENKCVSKDDFNHFSSKNAGCLILIEIGIFDTTLGILQIFYPKFQQTYLDL